VRTSAPRERSRETSGASKSMPAVLGRRTCPGGPRRRDAGAPGRRPGSARRAGRCAWQCGRWRRRSGEHGRHHVGDHRLGRPGGNLGQRQFRFTGLRTRPRLAAVMACRTPSWSRAIRSGAAAGPATAESRGLRRTTPPGPRPVRTRPRPRKVGGSRPGRWLTQRGGASRSAGGRRP
jgi:hypothetical protein